MSSKKKVAPAKKPAMRTNDGVLATQENYAKFVKAWEHAHSVKDVTEAMGISKLKAAVWSLRLRKAGVKLKKFRSGVKIDVAALNALVKAA